MTKRSKNKKRKLTGMPKLEVVETKLDKVVKERFQGGLIVYGVGAHLTDMLRWHPDLASRIVGVIDKNEEKIGKRAPGLTITVKSPEVLRDLPAGTQVAVSALRYYSEIVKELHGLNPGLVCLNIDQAYTLLKETEAKGMLVYGVGAHLADMLSWHPELAGRIARIFDKDEKKWGQKAPGTGRNIESTEVLRHLPAGTCIAISAIRYYDEIVEELYALNPGLICEDIDVAYEKLPPMPVKHAPAKPSPAKPVANTVASVSHELSNIQKQRLRGKEAAERWRRRFLMQCANVKKIFWGTKGIRASYLRRELQPLMGRGDIFIEEDLSLRGQVANGLPICIPDALKDVRGKFVIIVLDGDYPRIRELLQDYGYVENVDFVEGRQLLGEDENGYINVPCIDKTQSGMIVYGLGDHLKDMLNWHPELAGRISRIIDKDPKKTGTLAPGVGVSVEPPAVLRDLPSGTEVAISAIKYLAEIEKDIHAIQPGVICRNIDKIWEEYVPADALKPQPIKQAVQKIPPQPKNESVAQKPAVPAKNTMQKQMCTGGGQSARQALPDKYDVEALLKEYIGISKLDYFWQQMPEEECYVMVGWGDNEKYVASRLKNMGRNVVAVCDERIQSSVHAEGLEKFSYAEATKTFPKALYVIATPGRCYEKEAKLIEQGIKVNQFYAMDRAFGSKYKSLLLPDKYKDILAAIHYNRTHVYPDIEHPKTFNEHIIHDMIQLDQPKIKTILADKYLVREWVKEKIGEKYLIPLIDSWDNVEDIDFDKLPEQYVLQTNHGSGFVVIVDKTRPLNKNLTIAKFHDWMRTNFAYSFYEMHYKPIKPKIICSKFMENEDGNLFDYKVFCFNGEPKYIMWTKDRKTGLKVTFFDTEWNNMRFNFDFKFPENDEEIQRPDCLEEMLRLSKKLSSGFTHARIDWYVLKDGSIRFGEVTFSTEAGVGIWNPAEWNMKLGNLIKG